ncbi:right-handed parallel beta-helix repeat-containing protein [bacterium]|nr:right-handed parallel beta-helix repeat-containing protein [bacterium]
MNAANTSFYKSSYLGLKKFYALGLFLVLSFSFNVFGGEIRIEKNFSIHELIYQESDGYDLVMLPDASVTMKVGSPVLPRINIKVLIPSNATAENIEIVISENEVLEGAYNILPAQTPQMIQQFKGSSRLTEPDKEAYASSLPYPGKLFGDIHTGTKCGYRIADFDIYPLQYIPSEKKLILYTQFVFNLYYEEGSFPVNKVSREQSGFFGNQVIRMVENPWSQRIWGPEIGENTEAKLSPGNFEYVIIAPNDPDWIDSLEVLAHWKTRKGVPAIVVNLQTDIYDNTDYTGDNQWQIKQFIIDAVNTWGTQWVLLAADHGTDATNSIPCKTVHRYSTITDPVTDVNDLPCERYYEDVIGGSPNWNADGDGNYGECGEGGGGGGDDNVDWYADVYVGRMTADNAVDAGKYIRRILWFEKTPDLSFCKSAIFSTNQMDHDNCSNYTGYCRSDDLAGYIPAGWTLPGDVSHPGYHVDEGIDNYPGDVTFLGSSYLGTGYQFYTSVGHGNYNGFGGSGCTTPFITSTEINDYFDPGMKCGIFTSAACLSGGFDESDCAAEYLYDKGMVGGAMNSRSGWGYLATCLTSYLHQLSDGIVWQFYVKTFSESPYHLGEAIAEAKDQLISGLSDPEYNWCLKEFNTFGDPELPMWTSAAGPDNMVVTHNATVPMGASVFSVNVKDNDGVTNLQNALVTCWCKNDDAMYVRGYTDAFGNANLNINPSIAIDTMWVTVTKQDYIPYEGIAVIAAGAPDNPALLQPFDNARIGDGAVSTTPTLSWNVPSDGEGDPLNFKVQWASDEAFTSIISTIESKDNNTGFSPSPPLPQGTGTCEYTINSQSEGTLPEGTYWWHVAAHDGSNYGAWSEKRSFTINTSLTERDWHQTTGDQWNTDTLNETRTNGNYVELSSTDGYSETLQWDDGIVTSNWYGVNYFAVEFTPAEGCTIVQAQYSRLTEQSESDILYIRADDAGGNPGTILETINHSTTAQGDEASTSILYTLNTIHRYMGGDFWISVYTRTDELGTDEAYLSGDGAGGTYSYYSSDGSSWSNMASSESDFFIRAVVRYPGVFPANGYVISTPIDYDDNPGSTSDWGTLSWSEDLTYGDITIDIQYWDTDHWSDTPLTGITDNTDYDISSLDPVTHKIIRLIANLQNLSGSPILHDWTVTWSYGPPNDPPVVSDVQILGAGWRNGDVEITYDITDAEDDLCNIDCEWWNGSFWQDATVSGTTTGIDPPGTNLLITWHSVTDYNDESSGTIRFRIRGQGTGWGDYAESAVFDLDNKAPTGATCNTPSDGASAQDPTVTLISNTANDGGSGLAVNPYYFQLAEDAGFTTGLQNSGWQSAASWSPSLTNGKHYYWHVKAIDNVGNESAYSTTFDFYTKKYIFEVDEDGGMEYTTISAALSDVLLYWGSNAFDDSVIVDVYTVDGGDGDYDESVVPNTNLNPQSDARLIIKAANGQSPLIDAASYSYGINIEYIDYVTVRGFEVLNADLDGIRLIGGTDCILSYLKSHNNSLNGIRAGDSTNAVDNIEIHHCLCYDNYNNGIAVFNITTNGMVKNNTCYGNGHGESSGGGTEDDTLFFEDWESGSDGWTLGSWALGTTAGIAHSPVTYCQMVNTTSTCTYTGINVTNYDNLEVSVWVRDNGRLEELDCINGEYRLDGGAWTQFISHCDDQDSWGLFSTASPITGSHTAMDIQFTGNVGRNEYWYIDDILVIGDATTGTDSFYVGAGLFVGSGTGPQVKNNILVAKANAWDTCYAMRTADGVTISTASGYNDYEDNGNSFFIDQEGVKYNNIATWNSTSYGNNDISADALFVNAGTDFHIQSLNESYHSGQWPPLYAAFGTWIVDGSNSPCLDTGDPGDDYSYEPQSGGRINMGCYGNSVQASKSAPAGVGIQLLVANDGGADYTEWAIGQLSTGQVSIMNESNRVYVKNTGTLAMDLSIRASAIAWTYGDIAGPDECVLMALFNGITAPDEGNFNSAFDTLGTSMMPAGESPDGKFAGTANDGVNISIGSGEELYLYFQAPNPNTVPAEQNITITIQAVAH